MTDPYVFYRTGKGKKLIRFLETKLKRKKWKKLGWKWTHWHDEVIPSEDCLKIVREQSVGDLVCHVYDNRPDVITCNDVSNAYEVLLEILQGYPENVLIEIVK